MLFKFCAAFAPKNVYFVGILFVCCKSHSLISVSWLAESINFVFMNMCVCTYTVIFYMVLFFILLYAYSVNRVLVLV